MNEEKIARVVIAGRTNVGKSALFNRIAPKIRALVYDEKGVTRDILKDVCEWNGIKFEIIDTAGFAIKIGKDEILKKSIIETQNIFNQADIFIFVIDGDVEITNEDQQLLSYIKKKNTKIIFAINKSDKENTKNNNIFFDGMIDENTVYVSALHGRGIEDLLEKILESIKCIKNLKNNNQIEDVRTRVSFLGRPNVGKSSLLNALLNEERAIVSEIAGTTREAITEKIKYEDFSFMISDTAGVRRPRAVDGRLEELMVSNTINAIERSHIVVMVLDITVEDLPDQDIKLAMHAFYELGKGVIIVWNKIDLLEGDIQKKSEYLCSQYKYFFDFLPHLFISAKTTKGISRLSMEIQNLWKRYTQFFVASEIRKIVISSLSKIIMVRNEQKLVIKGAGVLKTSPPILVLRVSNPEFFGPSQLSFFTKKIRENYDLLGVPIKWHVEKK